MSRAGYQAVLCLQAANVNCSAGLHWQRVVSEVRKGIIPPCTALGRASGTPVWSASGQEMCLGAQWGLPGHMTEAEELVQHRLHKGGLKNT